MIAEVAFDAPVDHPFSYRVPPGLTIARGQRVLAPLKGARRVGVVVALRDGDESALKPLLGVVDRAPVLDPPRLELVAWIARESLSTVGSTAAALLPPPVRDRRARCRAPGARRRRGRAGRAPRRRRSRAAAPRADDRGAQRAADRGRRRGGGALGPAPRPPRRGRAAGLGRRRGGPGGGVGPVRRRGGARGHRHALGAADPAATRRAAGPGRRARGGPQAAGPAAHPRAGRRAGARAARAPARAADRRHAERRAVVASHRPRRRDDGAARRGPVAGRDHHRHPRDPAPRAADAAAGPRGARDAGGGPARAPAGEPARLVAGLRRVRRDRALPGVRAGAHLHASGRHADLPAVRHRGAADGHVRALPGPSAVALRLGARARRARGAPALPQGAAWRARTPRPRAGPRARRSGRLPPPPRS